jgi:hypothetical protein
MRWQSRAAEWARRRRTFFAHQPQPIVMLEEARRARVGRVRAANLMRRQLPPSID